MTDFIKVKCGISGSVAHELEVAGMDTYISDQITRIGKENPHLMRELCALTLEVADRLKPTDINYNMKLKASLMTAGIVVYRMLESQFDANKLNDLLG